MKLDGREFSGLDRLITAAQNDYLVGHLRLAGSLEVVEALGPKPTELAIDNARIDLVTKIFASGQKSFILAGLLTEDGKKWSRLEADRNAARFDETTDPADLELMTSLIVRAVIDVFSVLGKSSSPSDAVPAVLATKSAERA